MSKMYNKTPEEIRKLVDEAVDKLKDDIESSPWQIYPEIPIVDYWPKLKEE
jgi:hypothetical protein